MRQVLDKRTRYVTVVLEDIYQPHNAAAVLRSCECFGVQDVYAVEGRNTFDISSKISRKAHQWLTLHTFKQAEAGDESCFKALKNKGYKIATLTPEAETRLDQLPLNLPLAFVFGTEKEGVSALARNESDFQVQVPMAGFSESFNVSVTVAITLYETMKRLRMPEIESGFPLSLTSAEKEAIWYVWLKNTVKKSQLLEQEFLQNIKRASNPGK
ncbi:TrmH family RNA methyltransferase [Cyclonatronum proteinivorum]|nr:RNA methyltransferase [Cyclonatronum proteinivorum]